jgi:mono/diheme cytochrome c family protein
MQPGYSRSAKLHEEREYQLPVEIFGRISLMKLKLMIVACFALALSINAAPLLNARRTAGLQVDGQKMPAKMSFPSAKGEKWGPVAFDHDQHNAFSDCMICHHTNKGLTLDAWKGGKITEKIPLCVSCHFRDEGNAKNAKNPNGDELTAKAVYHANCIDCHKGEINERVLKFGKVTKQGEGPTKCAACHQAKE